MIVEKLVSEFLRILDKQGRDWHRVRWAIRGLEHEVRRSAGSSDPWQRELEEYLETKVCEALVLARDEAIILEELEWAHEISIRLQELDHEPAANQKEPT